MLPWLRKEVVDYIKSLGVTSVELLPIAISQTAAEPHL
jgi:pullulanase/glycogen debranching enzyme